MFKCNEFLESSYAIYFMYLNALFWKGVYGLFTRLPEVSMAPGYLQYPEKHLGRTEDGKFRGSALHTHTILDPHWHRGLLPWNQSPCQLLAAWFSERLQEWKLLLTRSITPLRLSQRNTIYYQHVFSSRRCLEKVSLYEYFKKADHKIRETWYLGFFFSPLMKKIQAFSYPGQSTVFVTWPAFTL